MEIVLRVFRNIFRLYYVGLLGAPYSVLKDILGENNIYPWTEPAFKIGLTLIVLFLIREVYVRITASVRERRLLKSMTGHTVREPQTVRDSSFVEELDMAQHPVHTLEQLKKEKRYGRMAEIYAKLNQPNEAARWFIKDGQHQRAAEELAKAGKTAKAARMLLRVGDYKTAARFYTSMGRHKEAAAALIKGGDVPGAACAYAEAGAYQKAAECFKDYFTTSQDPLPAQEAAADQCYRLLQQHDFNAHLKLDARNDLYKMVGRRFLAAGRVALAATLYQEGGDTRTAAEIHKKVSQAQKKGVTKTQP